MLSQASQFARNPCPSKEDAGLGVRASVRRNFFVSKGKRAAHKHALLDRFPGAIVPLCWGSVEEPHARAATRGIGVWLGLCKF